MILRIPFYRDYGIRRQTQMVAPPLHPVSVLTLPRDSLFHYFPTDPIGIAMDRNDPIFNFYEVKFAQMFHVSEYSDEEPVGRFRHIINPLRMSIMEFHRKNRFFRFSRDWHTALDNARMLTIFNYASLDLVYRYMPTPMMAFERWNNRYRTLWSMIAKVAKDTQRHQYVVLDIPVIQPPVTRLMKYEQTGMTTALFAGGLQKDDQFVVADMWTWLGHNRENSAIAQVSEDDLNRVNLIFMEAGKWTVINMGILNSWRERDDDEEPLNIELTKELNKGVYTSAPALATLRLQRRALRFFMALNEVALSTNGMDETNPEEDAIDVEQANAAEMANAPRDDNGELIFNRDKPVEKDEVAIEPAGPVVTAPDEVVVKPMSTGARLREERALKRKVANTAKGSTQLTSDDTLIVEDAMIDDPVYSDEDIERDLAKLEEIAIAGENDITLNYRPYRAPEKTLESGVMAQADELVKKGLLSPAQHRRMEKLANRYKELPNPYGEGKFLELLTIPPEDVLVEDTNLLVEDIKGVNDKSFLSSSLKAFDRRYTKKVLKKDVAKMAMSLQKAGVAIQSYDVSKVEDINDTFEIHTIRVQPVVGTASTLRFRLPVVDENGNFRVGGVMSRMRKQRGDIPIRKIGPDEVAMTSYYSKLFVQRTERMVFNFDAWLVNQITARGIDDEDSSVTEIRFGKPFIKEQRSPRHYTILAKSFLGFRSGNFTFDFNWKKRDEVFGKDLVALVDTRPELVLCGHDGATPIVMDMENKLYTVSVVGRTLKIAPINDLIDIIGLNRSKMPVELAEIGIFGKTVPLGFVMAYSIGLGDLLATIAEPYRRVKTRSHYQVADDEFDVRFEDETLIFKRTHRSMMIFGGFNRYHRDIKRLSVYTFDKKDIYSSVLTNNNVGVRVVKEMDLMFKMWVDHITEEILVDMGLPTDLFNLFITAVDMLQFDDHPDPMDNNYMRDKGYERFAGMAYAEMIKALRVYGSKPQTATATIDLNPEAVWYTILGDATINQVEDSNPIGNLQEKEVIVYRGEGGRSARSMTVKSRGYHESSTGVISEAGVDKGDVGTVIFATADPSYKNLRGVITPVIDLKDKTARVLSTSTLLGPWTTTDD